jgi:hypothetical protein
MASGDILAPAQGCMHERLNTGVTSNATHHNTEVVKDKATENNAYEVEIVDYHS